MNLENFRRQHGEIMEFVSKIPPLLEKEQVVREATTLRNLISNIVGKLSIHLAMEDKALYPEMFTNDNPRIREVSKRFFEEMGSLKEIVTEYNKKWPIPQVIEQDPERFITETKQIISGLTGRIEREDKELYPSMEG